MKKFARIENRKVVETLYAEELPEFHPSLHWEDCPADVECGWLFDGVAFCIPVVDVLMVKVAKWEAIKAERDRRTEQGGYKVGDKWFHSDQKSRSQQLGLVLLGTNIPANLQWKTMDGTFVTMTQQLAGQILAAGASSDLAIFAAAEAHKATMEANANPVGYDFSAGWPKTFGE